MSKLQVDSVDEVTSANGVTIDGLNIKDSKLTTANSVVTTNITDANVTTAKIADDAVTTDKLANSINSAITANTAKVTNATHSGEVTGATALTIADNAVTLAKMASGTDGNIISYDTSGNPVAVATGSSGQVLTSAGAGAIPSFQAAAAGGKILQAVTVTSSSEVTNTSNSYATSGLAVAITPSASSSKILVLVGSNFRVAGDGSASNVNREGKVAIFRGSVSGTLLQQQIIGITNISASSSSGNQSTNSISFAFLDSPSTTNATTYTVGISGLNNSDSQAQPFNFGSSMVLLEVGA